MEPSKTTNVNPILPPNIAALQISRAKVQETLDVIYGDKGPKEPITDTIFSVICQMVANHNPGTPASIRPQLTEDDEFRECINKERSELPYGELTDDQMANAIFLSGRMDTDLILKQTGAKERIRWLSRQLTASLDREKGYRAELGLGIVAETDHLLEMGFEKATPEQEVAGARNDTPVMADVLHELYPLTDTGGDAEDQIHHAYDRHDRFVNRPSRDLLDQLRMDIANTGVVAISNILPNTAIGSDGKIICDIDDVNYLANAAMSVWTALNVHNVAKVDDTGKPLSLWGRCLRFAGKS